MAGRLLRFVLQRAPFEAFRRRPGYLYVPDYYGRSASKRDDIRTFPVFGELAAKVGADGRTLLGPEKLMTIFQAIENLRRLSNDVDTLTIADIGSYRGGGGYFMAATAEALGFKHVDLHCFDTFAGHQKQDIAPELEPTQEAGRQQGRYRDVSPEDVATYLARFPGAEVHAGRFQETSAEVASARFQFAHVDVNLYEPTSFALSFLHQRLSDRGIMVVDDYGSVTNRGVRMAVDEFVEGGARYHRFHLLSDQCVLIKDSDRP